jgi:AraC-like DNA-binding protein
MHGYTLDDLVRQLHTSRSQIQRELSNEGTSFTAELRRIRLYEAVRLLRRGRPVAHVAQEVGLSPAQLRVLFVREIGVAPGRLLRASRLVAAMHRWKQAPPPLSGTAWYFEQRRRWIKAHAEAVRLLATLKPAERSGWADAMLAHTARPDYRRRTERQRAREAHRRENERHQRALEDLLRRVHEAEQAHG